MPCSGWIRWTIGDGLAKAVDHLSAAGVNVSVYNLPKCVLPRSVWPHALQSISDWKNGFVEECDRCDEKKQLQRLLYDRTSAVQSRRTGNHLRTMRFHAVAVLACKTARQRPKNIRNFGEPYARAHRTLIAAKEFSAIEQDCTRLAAAEGCSPTVARALESLVKFIEREEAARGRIARSERSHLADHAERVPSGSRKMMLILLGLGEAKHEFLRTRLAEML